MGRKVDFLALDPDLEAFLNFVVERGGLILPYDSATEGSNHDRSRISSEVIGGVS